MRTRTSPAGRQTFLESGRRGFTLLEVLVALIIFAIAFGALAGIFQTSLRQTAISEELRDATVLAEIQLARFGKDLPLDPGRTEGTSPGGLSWRAEVSLAEPVDADSGAALYRIRVEAGADDGLAGRVALETLRIGYGR